MNVTLFGGSFNPPHLGHTLVIDQVFELIPDIDEIWLLPDYEHSFPKNNDLAPVEDRLAMTQMLTGKRVRIQTCCIDQKMSGNTIEHLRFLEKKYNRHHFSFLMGSDNLKSFGLWPDWQTLLHLIPFYIYPRAGFAMEPLHSHMMPLTHPLQTITNISSTLIRERIKAKLSWEKLVPEKVAFYITQKRLFLEA